MSESEHDIVIIGASFAGLATAYFIKEGSVLLLERQEELGTIQKSTCSSSLKWIQKLNCAESVLKSFDYLTLHSSDNHTARIKLPETFCTVDYKRFCKTLAGNLKNTELLTGKKVTSIRAGKPNTVLANRESHSGRFIVNCSGWRGVKKNHINRSDGAGGPKPAFGLEVETEFDGDADSFHIYYGKKFIKKGYGWIFPTGKGSARIGLGGYADFKPKETLKSFLRTLGIKENGLATHGGHLPAFGLGEPIKDSVFMVGDACWQVLPLSGEGIRKAFEYAEFCGGTITRVLHDELTLEEGLENYKSEVLRAKPFYDNLRFIQTLSTHCPEWGRKRIIKSLSRVDETVLEGLLMRYLNDDITTSKSRILKAVLGGMLR